MPTHFGPTNHKLYVAAGRNGKTVEKNQLLNDGYEILSCDPILRLLNSQRQRCLYVGSCIERFSSWNFF
jgi:hypothetical protein